MKAWLEVYGVHLRISIAIQLQYRVSAIIWMISSVLQPIVYLVVWSTVARSQGGSAGGFTVADFAAYYIVFMLVDHLTFSWHMWEYDFRIREGLLSPLLLRPLHPIHADVADNIAHKLLTLTVMIPTALFLALVFKPQFEPPLWALAASVPAILFSFGLRFLLGWLLAIAAFWTTRIEALNNMYFVTELFFSGRLAPLNLLPAALQTVAAILPFRWGLAFPVELFLGRLSPRESAIGLGVQLGWLVVSFILVQIAWRAGVRRYAAFGA